MTEYMTIRGFVATAPETRTLPGSGTAVASFRLASTPRWFDAQTKEWREGHTNWYSVTCFRHLAGNVASSICVGQPVIVQGRLRIKNWEAEGIRRTAVEIEAVSLGPDLAFGTASFSRNNSARNTGQRSTDAVDRSEDPGHSPNGHWSGAADQPDRAREAPDFVRPQEEAPEDQEWQEPQDAVGAEQQTDEEGADDSGMTEGSSTDREILAMT